MTMLDAPTHYYKPIAGARVTPSGFNVDGSRVVLRDWPCPRCGQEVRNTGKLIEHAPCHDCRWFLREEYGDATSYDIRYHRPPPAALEPIDLPVSPVGFPLAELGADLPLECVEGWAA